jgi:hypothetical protein
MQTGTRFMARLQTRTGNFVTVCGGGTSANGVLAHATLLQCKGRCVMCEQCNYQYLGPRRGSNYRQYFVKGRGGLRAETLHRHTVGTEPRTPEQVAKDFDLPVEAVLEAIRYCTENEPLLREEREEELASIRARGLDRPPSVPLWYKPDA